MSTPVTELDQRFSQSDAVATEWEVTRRILETQELCWVTTVRADGRPHVAPLVAVWADDALWFCTGIDEQKAVNLRTNPHVILTIGNSTWDSGLDVVVEGDAVQVTDEDVLKHIAEVWTQKWDGRWKYLVRDGTFRHTADGEAIPVFSVSPTKILVFGKGTFTHTRHVF
jgi:general stress protein 26